jgi:hypothetical protein
MGMLGVTYADDGDGFDAVAGWGGHRVGGFCEYLVRWLGCGLYDLLLGGDTGSVWCTNGQAGQVRY